MSEQNEVRKLRQSVDALIGLLVIVALVCAIVFWAAPALKRSGAQADAYQDCISANVTANCDR